MTDSKPVDSKSNSIDYIVLSLDEKEYKRMNIIDKFKLAREGHKYILESHCMKCSEKLTEYYKQTYTISNPSAYDKKNILLSERAKEMYYVYGECSECNNKQRIGDKMFSIKYN